MDVLSGAASGMAVASLTLQLLESIHAITGFLARVKGASKELERLTGLLKNLGVLLEQVRMLTEKQTLLQHYDLSCQTITGCLQQCEGSLKALERLVDRLHKRRTTSASGITRLGNDVKFALKAREITGFEDRIQRDITNLNAALGINIANIQLTTLSVLLRVDQKALPVLPSTQSTSRCLNAAHIPSVAESQLTTQTSPSVTTKMRNSWVQSQVQKLGIHQRRSARYITVPKTQNSRPEYESEEIVAMEFEYFWTALRFGVHCSRRYPYGNILPALRIYPVVDDIYCGGPLTWQSTLEEVQQAFASGILHPFAKDKNGNTFLHYAAATRRPDICRLLAQYGLQPEINIFGASPLTVFLIWIGDMFDPCRELESKQADVDTLRVLLLQFDQIDNFENSLWRLLDFSLSKHLDVVEWLWNHAALVFQGDELSRLRIKLAQDLIKTYKPSLDSHNDAVNDLLIRIMDDEILVMYQAGRFLLLPTNPFRRLTVDSEYIGVAFINLLAGLQLDIETCMALESQHYSGNPSWVRCPGEGFVLGTRIEFERREDKSWTLRWEWDYEEDAPGYHVVSSFNALSGDVFSYGRRPVDWPFRDDFEPLEDQEHMDREDRKRTTQFLRRVAAKTRKERARNGEKLSRSKMPGAWVW